MAEAYNNLGFVYHQLWQYGKAVASLKQAIGLKPEMVVAYSNLGNAYIELRQYRRALEALLNA